MNLLHVASLQRKSVPPVVTENAVYINQKVNSDPYFKASGGWLLDSRSDILYDGYKLKEGRSLVQTVKSCCSIGKR